MSAIHLQWKSGRYAHSYQVWRNTVNNSGTASLYVTVTGLNYTDLFANEGTAYYYWIKAVNQVGVSGFGPVFGPITAGPTLPAPAELLATLLTIDDVVLTWAAAAGATKYDVYRHTAEDFGAASVIAADVAAETYTDTPPDNDTVYYYWVVAKNDTGGTSAPSAVAAGYSAMAAPAVPTGLTASDAVVAEVQLAWAAAARASVYHVYRSTTNDSGTAALIGDETSNAYIDSTATIGVTNYYWVKAVNYSGESAFSTGDSGVAAAPPPPAAPANVEASDGLTGKVTVTWDASAGATSYEVWRHTSNDSGGAAPIASGITDLEFDDETLEDEDVYYYWVKAVNAGGASGFSAGDDGYADFPTPDEPTGVAASDGNFGSTTVTWNAVAGATSYEVWRSPTSDPSAGAMLAAGLTVLTYDDETGADDVNYFYTVKATGPGGTSGHSIGDFGYRYWRAPAAPTGVAASDATFVGKVVVAWTAPSYADTFSVWRHTSDDSGGASQIASGIAGTTYDDETAATGILYYYWVKATNVVGTSGFSASDAGMQYEDISGQEFAGTGNFTSPLYGTAGGSIFLHYEAFSIADQFKVYNNGSLIYDTGCVTGNSNVGPISVASGTIQIDVVADCATVGTSSWECSVT